MDTVEGRIDGDRIAWHCDVFADVVYVRLEADRDTPTLADVTEMSDFDLRDEATGRLIGRTIIGAWRRSGQPGPPDSAAALGRCAEAAAVGL